MPCCNNECLENIDAQCIDYTGTDFQCISNEVDTLHGILQDIDTKLCSTSLNVAEATVTINTQCIAGTCPQDLTAIITYTNGVTNDFINVDIPGITSGTIVYTAYAVNVRVYSANALVASITDITSPFSILSTANNGTAVVLIIDLVVAGGISPYSALITIPSYSPNVTISAELICNANSTVTVSLHSLLTMMINKICDLQNQINAQ